MKTPLRGGSWNPSVWELLERGREDEPSGILWGTRKMAKVRQKRLTSRIQAVLAIITLCILPGEAQYYGGPGHSIGAVTVHGKLIVLTLNRNALGKANLFDLAHHRLRFTPDGAGYRVEDVPFVWDSDFGAALSGPRVELKKFTFPFSGREWNAFSVGVTGSIVFGETSVSGGERGRRGVHVGPDGGLAIERFAELREAGPAFINTVPAICVFFKPRLSGMRYVKEAAGRVTVTWSLTEPYGGIQDWTWTPTVNRFQAVLHNDGTIDLAWDDVAARDAVVGVYPLVSGGAERTMAVFRSPGDPRAAANLDIRRIRLSAVDGLYLGVELTARGPMLGASDPGIAGLTYRICLSKKMPQGPCTEDSAADAVWTVRGFGAFHYGRFSGGPRYRAFGAGLSPKVTVAGDTLSMEGTLPEGYRPGGRVYLSAAVQRGAGPAADVLQVSARAFTLSGVASPEEHLSSLTPKEGPFPVLFETFHYLRPTRAQDLSCSVIQALGDRFDMLAYYSDFRIDNPEAGTSSDGPLGGGPGGGQVTGIAAPQGNLADYCTKGRFQWEFIQPVYVGANQMRKYPPPGLTGKDPHNIAFYTRQLEERTFNGKIPPYDYAMSQIGHEMGHRWAAFVTAKVDGETIQLGPVHWAMGLQAPAAFPYQRPTEASIMGGGVWQDNYDGTFTQLDDNYYVPATGYSYLDLYLMGLIAPSEVPNFFLLGNLKFDGRDANGHPIFRADRTTVTIQDVIAAEGPREPDVEHSQRHFNTGIVLVVEHGKAPSQELIDRAGGIAAQWVRFWKTATGHRATMTTEP